MRAFSDERDKYSGDLKSGLVWILNGRKEVGLQMVRISNGILNLKGQPFETWMNGCHFFRTYSYTRYFQVGEFSMNSDCRLCYLPKLARNETNDAVSVKNMFSFNHFYNAYNRCLSSLNSNLAQIKLFSKMLK